MIPAVIVLGMVFAFVPRGWLFAVVVGVVAPFVLLADEPERTVALVAAAIFVPVANAIVGLAFGWALRSYSRQARGIDA